MAKLNRICSVDGCDKKHYGLGLCQMHHSRLRVHGDPLAGNTHKGAAYSFYRGAIAYQGDECLIWPFSRNRTGYAKLNMGGTNYYVSRLVCADSHGEPPSDLYHAAHTCGNGHLGCVNPRHIRWATPSENNMDKLGHGTHNRGERSPTHKLTEDEVLEIRALVGTMPQRLIAEKFGVGQMTVSDIHRRRRWAWLQDKIKAA